jgi:hypothetical protein
MPLSILQADHVMRSLKHLVINGDLFYEIQDLFSRDFATFANMK